MASRQSLSKTARFEIFKRDSFTCQYCGQRPPEVVLEIDHIHPVAAGGDNDPPNLVTACYDCNRGKSDKKLGDVAPKPDADLQFLAVQQEIAEIKRYMEAKEKREESLLDAVETLQNLWSEYMDNGFVPTMGQVKRWLSIYSIGEVDYAIRATSLPSASGRFGNNRLRACTSAIRYASAIMRNRKFEAEAIDA